MRDELGLLREVVEALAPLERRAGSAAEARAAEWLAGRLRDAGADVDVEPAAFRHGYANLLLPLGAAATAAGVLAWRAFAGAAGDPPPGARRRRGLATAVGALAAAAIIDDVENLRRVWRRVAGREGTTQNVVARLGDPAAPRTLLVLAHHDAAPTGAVFDPSLQIALGERFPALAGRGGMAVPLWWPVAGAPALLAAGALLGSRRVTRLGTLLCAATTVAGADIARDRVVAGANDDLSGCAGLVALAHRFADAPVEDLRVLLVSCGAEEVIQGGIHAFAARHFGNLPTASTAVISLDTIGSPQLVMLEGEGPIWMEDYPDPAFRDLIADTAAGVGIGLRRGVRARVSSDAVVPSRAGYPTVWLCSFGEHGGPTHYHLPTDVPEHLTYPTIAAAVALTDAVARRWAAA